MARTHNDPACIAVNCTLDHDAVREEFRDTPIGPNQLASNEQRGYQLLLDVITRHSFHYHDCQTTHCKAMFIWNSHEMTVLLADAYERGRADAIVEEC